MLLQQQITCRPDTITAENQYECHDLSMKQSAKIKFAQLKRFSPEHNLPITEKNSLEQAAFWHEVKVVCCLLTPLLLLRIIQTISKHAL